MRLTSVLYGVFIACIPSAVISQVNTFPDNKPFIEWSKNHAFPLENSDRATGIKDLEPVKKMIGNARVLMLGEPEHGQHEPLAFRNRLFYFLVEYGGFTTIILEANFAQSHFAACYINGGPGTAEEALQRMTMGKPSLENIELVEWMKKYNANTEHHQKIAFYGMDMEIQGFPGDTTPSHPALDQAINYLSGVDPVNAKKIFHLLEPYLNRLSVAKYALLPQEEHDRLTAILNDLTALFARERIKFIAATSPEKYEWAYRNAVVAQQTDRMVRVSPTYQQPGDIPADAWMAVSSRDAAMADNVLWIVHKGAGNGKVLVYAHNAHVKNEETAGSVWNVFIQPPNSAGQYLRSILKNNLLIIGSSCSPSLTLAQPGSLDSALSGVGKTRFIIDLREAINNKAAESWLLATHPMEANKVSYLLLHPGKAFDLLLFINKSQEN